MNEAGPMDADTPEIVEAVARAICRADGDCTCGHGELQCGIRDLGPFRDYATAAIAAARPFILEEAAKVARDYASKARHRGWTTAPDSAAKAGDHIATAIRSLSKDGEGLDAHQG